jgi:hypothetical protein
MFTILVPPPYLLRPGLRVVILILVIVAVCHFAPTAGIPVGLGGCLGWLTADRRVAVPAASLDAR